MEKDNTTFLSCTKWWIIEVHPSLTLTFMLMNSKQQSVIQQLHARRGRLIVMCSEGDEAVVCPGNACRAIEVPHVEDCLQPVVNVVPLQVRVVKYAFLSR